MRIAYVVSAYKLPDQLGRLLRRLRDPNATFIVHVDRKSSRKTYAEMRRAAADVPDVHFLPRHRSFWAGFGHVRTTLKGLERLIETRDPFDYVILLTAQDYPLAAPAVIAERLAAAEGRSFMSWYRMPSAHWNGRGGVDRFERLHFVWHRTLHVRLPWRRRIPGGLEPYGGSPYWCLSRAAVELVHDYVRAHPEYLRFFRTVYIPDELFFQTVLLNSPLRETIVNDNLRYIDWSRDPAPAILRASDFEVIVRSGKLFARKFDMTVDPDILDLLDEHIEGGVRAL